MICPRCPTLERETAELRHRILGLLSTIEALQDRERRTRERLAVLIGRVGVALDYLDAERATAEATRG